MNITQMPWSNFRYAQRFTVQAHCSGLGWVDTKRGGNTLAAVEAAQTALLKDDNAWMPGNRLTRIAKTCGHPRNEDQ